MSIRGVLLDAGGVLVKSYFGEWNIPRRLFEILGERAGTVPGKEWYAADAAERYLIREDVLMTSLEQEYIARRRYLENVGLRLNWQMNEEELNALAADFTNNPERYIWFEEVDAALMKLREAGFTLAVLSDATPSIGEFIRAHDKDHLLDDIVLSTQVGACKPEPVMYQTILSRLPLKPEEWIFVDDRACNLEGAKQQGMNAVQMVRNNETVWGGPVIHNLFDLVEELC